MLDALREVEIVRVRDGHQCPDVDRTAAEELLEVRVHGRPFAVIMRTPGSDLTSTAGFLLAAASRSTHNRNGCRRFA